MAPPRILPPLDGINRPFWTGGHRGHLVLERCEACDRWQHPPVGRCEVCDDVVVHRPVSGRGSVFTCTVNEHAFHPEVPPPYVIAIVELEEQVDLRVVANVVDVEPRSVAIGDPVEVAFEVDGEHAVPVFWPCSR